MWKKWNHSRERILLFNLLAVLIAFIGVFVGGLGIYFIINFILLAFISFVLFVAYKESKNKQKGKSLYFIYLMLFIFWILNVIDILIPKFLEIYQIVIYIVSILLFMIILYRVLKKIGD
jgi:O-antigen/teichoic acid export membrane protein